MGGKQPGIIVQLGLHTRQAAELFTACHHITRHINEVPTCREWELPNADFHGLWQSLTFEQQLPAQLLGYARSALLFSGRRINPHIISWNRIVLLHGPAGTGEEEGASAPC